MFWVETPPPPRHGGQGGGGGGGWEMGLPPPPHIAELLQETPPMTEEGPEHAETCVAETPLRAGTAHADPPDQPLDPCGPRLRVDWLQGPHCLKPPLPRALL